MVFPYQKRFHVEPFFLDAKNYYLPEEPLQNPFFISS